MDKYYDILGVSKQSSNKEIKEAFKEKSREFHPDINDSEEAKEKLEEIDKAYSFLKKWHIPPYVADYFCFDCKRHTRLEYGSSHYLLMTLLILLTLPIGLLYCILSRPRKCEFCKSENIGRNILIENPVRHVPIPEDE